MSRKHPANRKQVDTSTTVTRNLHGSALRSHARRNILYALIAGTAVIIALGVFVPPKKPSGGWERYDARTISFVGKLDGVALSAGAPAIAPGFTLDLMARHSLDFWLTSEDLPHPDSRVALDRDGNIVLSYVPNNLEAHKRLRAKLESLMQQQTKCDIHGKECHQGLFARSLFVGERIPLAGVAHQCGTLRFGHDPKTSVLDVHCKAHDLDNLYVVDGSFFPSSGAVNPALTIAANALRVGDHLRERLGVVRGEAGVVERLAV